MTEVKDVCDEMGLGKWCFVCLCVPPSPVPAPFSCTSVPVGLAGVCGEMDKSDTSALGNRICAPSSKTLSNSKLQGEGIQCGGGLCRSGSPGRGWWAADAERGSVGGLATRGLKEEAMYELKERVEPMSVCLCVCVV
jgi:hypothetical protein